MSMTMILPETLRVTGEKLYRAARAGDVAKLADHFQRLRSPEHRSTER